MTDVWLTGHVHPVIKGGVVCSLRHQGVRGCRGGVYSHNQMFLRNSSMKKG